MAKSIPMNIFDLPEKCARFKSSNSCRTVRKKGLIILTPGLHRNWVEPLNSRVLISLSSGPISSIGDTHPGDLNQIYIRVLLKNSTDNGK
jgi:hypothetical protein